MPEAAALVQPSTCSSSPGLSPALLIGHTSCMPSMRSSDCRREFSHLLTPTFDPCSMHLPACDVPAHQSPSSSHFASRSAPQAGQASRCLSAPLMAASLVSKETQCPLAEAKSISVSGDEVCVCARAWVRVDREAGAGLCWLPRVSRLEKTAKRDSQALLRTTTTQQERSSIRARHNVEKSGMQVAMREAKSRASLWAQVTLGGQPRRRDDAAPRGMQDKGLFHCPRSSRG